MIWAIEVAPNLDIGLLLKLVWVFRVFFNLIRVWTLGIVKIGWGLQSALSLLEILYELRIAGVIWVLD